MLLAIAVMVDADAWVLVVLTFVATAAGTPYSPAVAASMPGVVGTESLPAATAL